MSKSLGNSPDPIDLMDKFGADGLRFGLMRIAPVGADVRFDESSAEEGRNFANKLYNACRFRQMDGNEFAPLPSVKGLPVYHILVMSKLDNSPLISKASTRNIASARLRSASTNSFGMTSVING